MPDITKTALEELEVDAQELQEEEMYELEKQISKDESDEIMRENGYLSEEELAHQEKVNAQKLERRIVDNISKEVRDEVFNIATNELGVSAGLTIASLSDLKSMVQSRDIRTIDKWKKCAFNSQSHSGIPMRPDAYYGRSQEWKGWYDFFDLDSVFPWKIVNPVPYWKRPPEDQDRYMKATIADVYKEAMVLPKKLYDPENPQEGDVPPPTIEEVSELLAANLTAKQFEGIKNMELPILQLIPVCSFDRYEQALYECYSSIIKIFSLSYINKTDPTSKKKNIIAWKIAVTEGISEPALLPNEDNTWTLGQRLLWFNDNYKRYGISGVSLKQYMLLHMNAITSLLDMYLSDNRDENGTFTMCNADSTEKGIVQGSLYDEFDHPLDFWIDIHGLDEVIKEARFRASIVFDVPQGQKSQ